MSSMEMMDLTGLREVLPLMILLSRDTSHVNSDEYNAFEMASLASRQKDKMNIEILYDALLIEYNGLLYCHVKLHYHMGLRGKIQQKKLMAELHFIFLWLKMSEKPSQWLCHCNIRYWYHVPSIQFCTVKETYSKIKINIWTSCDKTRIY